MSQPNCASVRTPPERGWYSSPASIPGTKSANAMKTMSAMMRAETTQGTPHTPTSAAIAVS
jgi:hypothetical protein